MANGQPPTTLACVGSVTRPNPYYQGHNGRGLSMLRFDEATGASDLLSETGGIDNPTFLTIDRTGQFLYATSEVFGWHEGRVTAYRIDPVRGTLTYINAQSTHGSIAAYAGIDRTGRWLLVANYRLGPDGARRPQSLVVFPIEPDGGIGNATAAVSHAGTGPNPERQEGPHPHCAVASPDNRHVLVADLGIDRIMVYAFNAANGGLAPATRPFVRLAPGSGPRHLAFHPSGRFLFVINEMASSVTSLAWDPATGALEPLDTQSTLPADFAGVSTCSDLNVTSDGLFLYGANRGHDSIAIFGIDLLTGKLVPHGQHTCGGKTPRQFALDPGQNFLLVANQDSDAVAVLARDRTTGALSDTGHRAALGTPMCVKLIRYT